MQSRFVTDDVERLAGFYAALLRARVALNEYYVEVPAGPASIGFCRRRFTESRACRDTVLDFLVDDVDAECGRVSRLGVDLVMPPTDQPWGSRAMLFADPEGHLINVFSRRCPG